MAEKHPYISGSGPLFRIFAQLRKSFPAGGVTANTLKKLGLAPNNESYVINVLRFIDVIDGEGKKTEAAGKVFNQHDEAAFAKAFSELVKKAYSELFSLHGEDAWEGRPGFADSVLSLDGRHERDCRPQAGYYLPSVISAQWSRGSAFREERTYKQGLLWQGRRDKEAKGSLSQTGSSVSQTDSSGSRIWCREGQGGWREIRGRCRPDRPHRDQSSSRWRPSDLRSDLQEHSRKFTQWEMISRRSSK